MARKSGKKSKKLSSSIKKIVKAEIHKNIEDKYLNDNVTAVTAVSDNATTILCNGLSPSATIEGRIGEKIRMTRMQGNFAVATAGAAIAGTTSTYYFRLMLIYDKQPNGSGITLNQLFINSGAGNTFLSLLNPAGSDRYKVLFDKIYNMPIGGGVANVSENRIIRVDKKLRHMTHYNDGNAGTVSDINTGSLYWLLCSDSTNLVYKASYTLRFEDA